MGATHQMREASRTLVELFRGAMRGSAIMRPDSTAPPKQKSMELNQQASGLLLDTSSTPEGHHHVVTISSSSFSESTVTFPGPYQKVSSAGARGHMASLADTSRQSS